MRIRPDSSARLILVFCASTAGCGAGPTTSAGEATGKSREAIVDGDPVTVATQQTFGLVSINQAGCSGVLLSNQIVLTAGHCITEFDGNTGTSMSASINEPQGGTSASTSDAVYQFGSHDLNFVPDLALLHLAQPLVVNSSTTGFKNLIDPTPSAALPPSVTLSEFGLGWNQLTTVFTTAGWAPGTVGEWLSANLTVTQAGSGYVTVKPNDEGQISLFGDSGGPYFRVVPNVGVGIVSIQSNIGWCDATCSNTNDESTVASVISSRSTDVADWIDWLDAIQWDWNSSSAVSASNARLAEIQNLARDPVRATQSFTDVNVVSWSAANLAASYLCFNRGFGSGHFNGQEGNGLYGLVCESSGTSADPGMAGADVTLAQIDASPEPFTDIHQIGWAQANREAQNFCQGLGLVGGRFDGWEDLPNGRYGLACVRHAVPLTATAHQLLATGWPVNDVNATSWAQAARAASAFCTARGYVGGFMNGSQNLSGTISTFGVVCESAS